LRKRETRSKHAREKEREKEKERWHSARALVPQRATASAEERPNESADAWTSVAVAVEDGVGVRRAIRRWVCRR